MSAPVARTSAGRIAFTVAAVPTGMKAGVRISPLRIWIDPVRALPSVAAMVKENRLWVTRRALKHRAAKWDPVFREKLPGEQRGGVHAIATGGGAFSPPGGLRRTPRSRRCRTLPPGGNCR